MPKSFCNNLALFAFTLPAVGCGSSQNNVCETIDPRKLGCCKNDCAKAHSIAFLLAHSIFGSGPRTYPFLRHAFLPFRLVCLHPQPVIRESALWVVMLLTSGVFLCKWGMALDREKNQTNVNHDDLIRLVKISTTYRRQVMQKTK